MTHLTTPSAEPMSAPILDLSSPPAVPSSTTFADRWYPMLVFGEQALLSAALFLALYLGLEWLFVHYPPGFLAAVFGLVFSLFQSLFGRGVSKRRR